MIVIASDHGGYALKQELMAHLKEKGVKLHIMGPKPGDLPMVRLKWK